MATKRFRIAFSFAGEKRAFVAKVAAILAKRFGKEHILYDKYCGAEFASADLGIELPDLYHDESDLVVVVLCKDYSEKEWCGLEWRAIHALIKERKGKGVMLSRFDHAKVKGLFSTAGFAELDEKTPAQAAALIIERYELLQPKPKKKPSRKAKPTAPASPRISIPNNLPHLPYFFGRTEELKKLADALSPKTRTWGALIDGPGGMGKTSLAIRAAEESASLFQHIYFLSPKERKMTADGEKKLTDFVVPGYLDMLNELARLLKLPDLAKRPEGDRARLLIGALAPVQALLILDNLESLPKDDQNRLFDFLSQLPPGCKAIVTSRRRTDVDARIIRLGKLEQDAALALIAELAADRPLLQKATAAERIHLYGETGGNPLLLRWIAGQLGRGSCRTLAAALALCRRAEMENDPLEFIFGDLLETFTEAETKALAALSYFTQQVEVKLIAELADLSKTAAETALGDLANRALVIPDEEEKHFALVPMVADFLRKKRPETIDQTGLRLEKHAFDLVRQNGYEKFDRFPVLDAEWRTVSAALPRFLSGPNDRLQTVCDALFTFLHFSGRVGATGTEVKSSATRWDEWLALSQQAEMRAVATKNFMKAGYRAHNAGWVYHLRDQSDEVFACAARAATYWKNAGAGDREASSVASLRGHAYQLVKDHRAALEAFSQALELDRKWDANGIEVTNSLNKLANAERECGRLEDAERDYREALRIASEHGDTRGVAMFISNLAALALGRKEWSSAEKLSREALALNEKIGPPQLIAHDCHRLASALIGQGRAAEAFPYARRSVELFTMLGVRELESPRSTLKECRLAFALERLNHGWTYNTTTLEGNTLTLEQTREALANPDAVFPGRPAADTAATRAQGAALQVVAEFIRDDREWRVPDLFRLHTVLMQGSTVDSLKPVGTWKIEDNGTSIKLRGQTKKQWNDAYAAAHEVPAIMADWLAELNRLRNGADDPFSSQVWLHACFARIHPFADGNGRMARMLANIPLLAAGLDPVDIPATARARYLASLASWQMECGAPRTGDELFAKPKLLADFRKLCAASRASAP